jgi:hypothetical protein
VGVAENKEKFRVSHFLGSINYIYVFFNDMQVGLTVRGRHMHDGRNFFQTHRQLHHLARAAYIQEDRLFQRIIEPANTKRVKVL